MGMISAKIKIMIVVTVVDTRSINSSLLKKSLVNKIVEIDAAAIFTRLFPIKTVDKNSSGLWSIFARSSAFLSFFLALRFSFILLMDMMDVSADEKKALNKIKIKKTRIYIIKFMFYFPNI